MRCLGRALSAWLESELSAKLIANAVLSKEQRPAKKHENELIFLKFYFLYFDVCIGEGQKLAKGSHLKKLIKPFCNSPVTPKSASFSAKPSLLFAPPKSFLF